MTGERRKEYTDKKEKQTDRWMKERVYKQERKKKESGRRMKKRVYWKERIKKVTDLWRKVYIRKK